MVVGGEFLEMEELVFVGGCVDLGVLVWVVDGGGTLGEGDVVFVGVEDVV